MERVGNAGGRELERVYDPLKVRAPAGASAKETLTDGGLADLDGLDADLLEVNNLVRRARASCLDWSSRETSGRGKDQLRIVTGP